MSTKLYADDRCIAEFGSMNATQNGTYSPSQKDAWSSVTINTERETKKKPCNCPNCGAPINGYICAYCGTEFEKPEKKLSDQEMRESFVEFTRQQKLIDELKIRQRQAELQSSQEWQTQNLLNALNVYGVNTQIMNVQDSINSAMALQACSLHDQMYNASMQTNIYPVKNDIEQKIPINKSDYETIDKKERDHPISKSDEELASAAIIFMIGMILFTIFAIIVTVIYNLL